MKKWLQDLGSAAIAAGLFFSASATALAHTMPEEEATLIVLVSPYGHAEFIPNETTLGEVEAVEGHDVKKKDFTGDGRRIVTYEYVTATFWSIVGAADDRDANELPMTGYDLRSNGSHTLSRFSVGEPYAEVVEKYGEADYTMPEKDGLVTYGYKLDGRPIHLTFDVNGEGRIRAIHCRRGA